MTTPNAIDDALAIPMAMAMAKPRTEPKITTMMTTETKMAMMTTKTTKAGMRNTTMNRCFRILRQEPLC